MKLRCCPFCKSEDVATEHIGIHGTDFWSVDCKSCETTGPERGTEKAAIAAWNTRPLEDEILNALMYTVKSIGGHLSLEQQWVFDVIDKASKRGRQA